MADEAVHERIEQLVAEEHELFQRAEGDSGLSDEEHRRLETIRVGLDQCWDLLRQRRALREAGRDPRAAHVRDPGTRRGLRAVGLAEQVAQADPAADQALEREPLKKVPQRRRGEARDVTTPLRLVHRAEETGAERDVDRVRVPVPRRQAAAADREHELLARRL